MRATILADAQLPLLQSLDARLLLAEPRAIVMAPVTRAIIGMSAVGLVALSLAMVMAWQVSARFTRPVLQLVERVRARAGDCAPTGTDDELEILAEAFDERTRALRTAQLELEDRVHKRTQSLLEKTDELQRSNRELDEFTYVVSHDLEEPLRGIRTYVGLLIEDYGARLDDEGREMLSTVAKLSRNMEQLIADLLDFSRLGRVDLAVGPVDLDQILAGVRESLEVTLEQARVELRVPRPLPRLVCDRVRVAELLRNLMTNAIKYNDKAHKWLEIGWEESRKPRGEREFVEGPVIYVRDNGIGIPQAELSKVFGMFGRLESGEKVAEGHGIGLAIVQKIVARHRGRVWAESKIGDGTCFFFTLHGEDIDEQTPNKDQAA